MHDASNEPFERARRNLEKAKRTNAIVSLSIGIVFACIGLACFVATLGIVVTGIMEGDGGAGLGVGFGVGLFGLFWAATATLLIYIGWRGVARSNRDRRLRSIGVRGSATIVEYKESSLRVDGATMFALSMRIALPDRPPWDLSRNEAVERSHMIYHGAIVPVLVDPADTTQVMIDWWGNP